MLGSISTHCNIVCSILCLSLWHSWTLSVSDVKVPLAASSVIVSVISSWRKLRSLCNFCIFSCTVRALLATGQWTNGYMTQYPIWISSRKLLKERNFFVNTIVLLPCAVALRLYACSLSWSEVVNCSNCSSNLRWFSRICFSSPPMACRTTNHLMHALAY